VFHFQNKLNHVVAKWIFDKNQSIICNFKNQRFLLLFIASIDTFLHNATPVFVTGNLHTLLLHRIEQELVVRAIPA